MVGSVGVEMAPGIPAAAGPMYAATVAIPMPGRAIQALVVVLPRSGVLSLSPPFSVRGYLDSRVLERSD